MSQPLLEISTLQILDLSRNGLIGSIPLNIRNCSNLTVLDLQNNNLSVRFQNLWGLHWLQILHLSNNRFSGEIPSSLQELKELETLDLGNNSLTGNIPSWIGGAFPRLRILSLRSNSFSGEIPSRHSNLSSLQVLDLAGNKLNGRIPSSFGDFKAMLNIRFTASIFVICSEKIWGGVYFAVVDRIVNRLSNASALVDRIVHRLSSASSRIATRTRTQCSC
ncbi:hypothetical protein GH714_002503 [Hevea brasiliensis]|uniref:Leucine-rich repeat-containing N-terminal plant-type domain-containing protein n=1 Tax=Hevea brasiliensis TaxID=3981 RepID=A0A6A6L1G5_HEVBR|nr:hypothetical protein GH714_002503 [Hevea brasiliensis]